MIIAHAHTFVTVPKPASRTRTNFPRRPRPHARKRRVIVNPPHTALDAIAQPKPLRCRVLYLQGVKYQHP
ncbi:hypothetical protein H2248_011901 [Termitomyces sp. 'cryptogamus']|nr:hypothetical protein H2248_011901 [Termitomyces sp. 'cryptogamus']